MLKEIINEKLINAPKNRKKVGIIAILIIVIVTCFITYSKFGFKELKKNDTEDIFIEEETGGENSQEEYSINKSKTNDADSKAVVATLKDKTIVVEIKGEVKKPDVYELDENSIVKDLIDKAGGLTENADLTNINRAKKLQSHELIYIGNKNDAQLNKGNPNTSELGNSSAVKGSSNGIVNINTADTEELKTLNGIGDAKAKNIIDYREQNGGFKSIEDLKNVTGIGDKMFEKIREQVTV